MVTTRRYPPLTPAARRTPAPPVSNALPEWRLLTSVDQGSGSAVAPFDPGSFGNTGTVFDDTTGTFTIIEKGDTTSRQGYRSSLIRWTKKVTDLYPTFDPATDVLEVAVEILSIPKTGTAAYGIFCAVLDEPTATLASADGTGWCVRENTLTNYLHAKIAATNISSSGQFPTALELAHARFWTTPDGARINYFGWERNTSNAWQSLETTSTAIAINSDPDTWYLHVGDVHGGTTSGTPTMSFRVYHRLLRTTGIGDLPA